MSNSDSVVHVEFDFDTTIVKNYARERFGLMLFESPSNNVYSTRTLSESENSVRKVVDKRIINTVLELDIEGAVRSVAQSVLDSTVKNIVGASIRREVKEKVKELKKSGELFADVESGDGADKSNKKEEASRLYSELYDLLNTEGFLQKAQHIAKTMRELKGAIDEF